MTLIIALLDLYEQFLITATMFTLIPAKGSIQKQTIYFFALMLFLFLSVRISNSLELYDGMDIVFIISVITIYMKFISNRSIGLILLYSCTIFMVLGFVSTICYSIFSFFLNITTGKILNSTFLLLLINGLSKIILTVLFLLLKKRLKIHFIFKSKEWGSLLAVEVLAFLCLIIYLEFYFYGYDLHLNQVGIILTVILFASEFYVFSVLMKRMKKNEYYNYQSVKLTLTKSTTKTL